MWKILKTWALFNIFGSGNDCYTYKVIELQLQIYNGCNKAHKGNDNPHLFWLRELFAPRAPTLSKCR